MYRGGEIAVDQRVHRTQAAAQWAPESGRRVQRAQREVAVQRVEGYVGDDGAGTERGRSQRAGTRRTRRVSGTG